MSMKLMVKAMEAKVGNPLRKLVLLNLCDHANEKGECYPSFQYIADKCEISKRSAITHVQELVRMGFISQKNRFNNNEKTSNQYFITIENGSAGDAPPSAGDAPPSAGDAPPPSAGDAHRISHSFEPVIESKKNNTKKSLDFSSWPEIPSEQTLSDWIAMRKRRKADISQTVINQFGKQLRLAIQFGYSVEQCISECVTRNWIGFKADWMRNSEVSYAANQSNVSQRTSSIKPSFADIVRSQARQNLERIDGEAGHSVVYPIR